MPKRNVFQEKNSIQLPGEYSYTSMVSHRGTVVSFGMNTDGRIKFAVLDLSSADATIDSDAWSDISDVVFPSELSQVGFAIIKNYQMPIRGSLNQLLTDEEQQLSVLVDNYHSTTAKLSACAPFQVISDGKYIYLFRQAKPGEDKDVDKIGSDAPIVNNTLLVDRFVLGGTQLRLSREIRYQRSGHKTQPASRKDTLSAKDIEEKPFYEPTQELGFVINLTKGGFSILQVPTEETEVKRWQIFYYDSLSKKVNAVSLKTNSDGRFDPTNSATFVEQFMAEQLLHGEFVEKVAEQIRNQADDDSIAALLKSDASFSTQLADVEAGELAEVVYAIRTGLVKDDFSLAGNYEVETGMSSIFYYQQELDVDTGKPMKSKASVMLAMGLKPLPDGKNYLAVLNFAVSPAGTLSRLSAEDLQLPELDLSSIDEEALLSQINVIEDDNVVIKNEIEKLRKAYIDDIETQTTALKTSSSPSISKAVTDAMISPWHGESQVYQHSTNLTVVNQAISEINSRRAQYREAINTLNNAESALMNEVLTQLVDSTKSKQVSACSQSFELKYRYANLFDKTNPAGHGPAIPFDASFYDPLQKKTYFIKGNRCWRWSSADGVDSGYPRKISDEWPGVPDRLDASFYHTGNKRMYFFRDDLSWQYTPSVGMDDGYPKKIRDLFPGVPDGLDAAFYNPNDKIYFFKGDEYWRYEPFGKVDPSYPMKIKNRWGSVPGHLDAAYADPIQNKIYFFKGDEYWQNAGVKTDSGYPKKIRDKWHDVVTVTTVNGVWDSNCEISQNRTGHYARYFSIEIQHQTDVKISLESTVDTYLYLLDRNRQETIIFNDDGGAGLNSLLETRLDPDMYVIEATTFRQVTAGTFTLSVDGVSELFELGYLPRAEAVKDDRPTLQKLIDFESNRVLDFYLNRIKPKLEKLNKNQNELNENQQQLKAGISSIPMPIIEVDDNALTTTGGLLKFAYTADKPFLFDDSLGRVSLFFRGENENFFAAYFNPNIAQYVTCEPLIPTGLSFKPLLTTDINVEINFQSSGNSGNLCIKDVQNQLAIVEQWRYLPSDSVNVAKILNGGNRMSLGYLAVDYQATKTVDDQRLTIACTAASEFLPTMDLTGLSSENGTEVELTEFLAHNRTMIAGNKQFTIAAGSQVGVKAGALLKSSLNAIVRDPSHVDLLWDYLKNNGLIRESASLSGASFADDIIFASDAETQLQSRLNLPAELQDIETALIELITRVAKTRQLSFAVEPDNTQAVDGLSSGLDVHIKYNYNNFSCTPSNLSAIDLDSWPHKCSFVFRAASVTGMDMAEFTSTYSATNAMGKWEAYHPGLAMSFDRSLEVDNGQGKAALLTTSQQLAELQPTARGLALESWINPRGIAENQARSLILGYRNDRSNYNLGISREGGQYRCFATIENKRIVAKSALDFGCWKHLAVSYRRFWGIALNTRVVNGGQINCGNDMSLSLDREFAVELMIQPNSNNATLLDKTGEFKIDLVNGIIRFFLGDVDVLAGNGLTIKSGEFKKVTIIRSKSKPLDTDSTSAYPLLGKESSDVNGSDTKWYKDKSQKDMIAGMAERQDQMYQNSQTAQQGMNLALGQDDGPQDDNRYFHTLVVGEQSYTTDKLDAAPGVSQFSELHMMSGFDGVFSGARIWARGLSLDEAKSSSLAGQNSNSLMAWWRISEGQGKFIYDDAGKNHGIIQAPDFLWVDSPDTRLPRYLFYIDGMLQAVDVSEVEEISPTDQFSVGGIKNGDQIQQCFDGVLEEIRIWGEPRSAEEIHDNAFGRLKGEREKLLANYTFDTNFSEYKKSALAAVTGLTEAQAAATWSALLKQKIITVDGAVKDQSGLSVTLEEVITGIDQKRIVNEAATVLNAPAQIKDLGFNSVSLAVEGHIWSGRLGEENITQVLSTAPISDEIPVVRSALSGVATDYNDNISSAPAIVEYGDIQENADGTINGILKRCYSYIRDGNWHLVTGYKVGNLVTEWHGQVQFDPQVMGYLEGTPPVPGENFPIEQDSDIDGYADDLDSSVELEQAEVISYNYSNSKESGYQVSAESEVTAGLALNFVLAPFGFGIEFGAEVGGKATTNWEHGGDRSQSFEHGVSVNRDRIFGASLAGYDNAKDGAERYYKFGNTGFALVKSKTADVYLLRLEHNNALVSISWRPNPDIPEDTNIISFPINPLYVKQGSLDGKFGTSSDDHYPLAQSSYGEYSYYKPTEAYRLKRRIEREKQQAASYYNDFSTDTTDGRVRAAIASTGVQQLANLVVGYGPLVNAALNQTLGQVATQQTYNDLEIRNNISHKMSQRNLVNSYIWTIEGGFYAESTQIAETWQEVYSNNYSLELGGALGITYKAEGGVGLEQEALFGSSSSLTVTKTKTKDSSKSFGVNLSVSLPTSPRYRYDGLTLKKGLIGAGTVDAYRFMSYFLEPQPNNYVDLFTQVIEPKWLDESPDPNAVALRKARNDSKKPFCWRVMYRTIFVSRILPEFEPDAAPSLEKVMREKNIESNYALIKVFEPYVGQIMDPSKFINKIDEVIEQKLPEFIDYKREIKRYLELYYGIV